MTTKTAWQVEPKEDLVGYISHSTNNLKEFEHQQTSTDRAFKYKASPKAFFIVKLKMGYTF